MNDVLDNHHIITFNERIQINNNGCWIWVGHTHRGYGKFYIKGKYHRAHRISYEYFYDVDPGELNVLHECDNPTCVNPNHLFLGTQNDNIQDMINKGRCIKGEMCARAVLTEPDVVEIKHLLKTTSRSGSDIGRQFNVGAKCISNIKNNDTWRHIE